MSESLTLVPFLGHFSFCVFVLFNPDEIDLLYLIFYFVMFYCHSLEACSFSSDRQKGSASGWVGRWKRSTGRSREIGNYNQILLCKKKSISTRGEGEGIREKSY